MVPFHVSGMISPSFIYSRVEIRSHSLRVRVNMESMCSISQVLCGYLIYIWLYLGNCTKIGPMISLGDSCIIITLAFSCLLTGIFMSVVSLVMVVNQVRIVRACVLNTAGSSNRGLSCRFLSLSIFGGELCGFTCHLTTLQLELRK